MTITNLNEAIIEAVTEVLKTGSTASKVYVRIRPNGAVDTSEETGMAYSEREYFGRAPHTLSLEIGKGERDYSHLTDEQIEECQDNAREAAEQWCADRQDQIERWIEAGNLIAQGAQ